MDTRTNSSEENYKLPKEKVSENKRKAEQREINKEAYFAQKAKYAATIKREKTKSWKEYYTLTTEANPWNAVCIDWHQGRREPTHR